MTEEGHDRRPKAPAGLGRAGRGLWRQVTAVLELEATEIAVLELACRQLDDVKALESLVAADGLTATGSAGQVRLSAAVTELRQARLAVGKLLSLIAVPDDHDRPMTTSAQRARHAAEKRWSARRLKIEEKMARGSS